jgi:hypothetical protein
MREVTMCPACGCCSFSGAGCAGHCERDGHVNVDLCGDCDGQGTVELGCDHECALHEPATGPTTTCTHCLGSGDLNRIGQARVVQP